MLTKIFLVKYQVSHDHLIDKIFGHTEILDAVSILKLPLSISILIITQIFSSNSHLNI